MLDSDESLYPFFFVGIYKLQQQKICSVVAQSSGETLHLAYYYYIGSEETDCSDTSGEYVAVSIDGIDVDGVNLCTDTSSVEWQQAGVDMSSYAGQTIEIMFTVSTNSVLNSNFFLDDVAFVMAVPATSLSMKEPSPALSIQRKVPFLPVLLSSR